MDEGWTERVCTASSMERRTDNHRGDLTFCSQKDDVKKSTRYSMPRAAFAGGNDVIRLTPRWRRNGHGVAGARTANHAHRDEFRNPNLILDGAAGPAVGFPGALLSCEAVSLLRYDDTRGESRRITKTLVSASGSSFAVFALPLQPVLPAPRKISIICGGHPSRQSCEYLLPAEDYGVTVMFGTPRAQFPTSLSAITTLPGMRCVLVLTPPHGCRDALRATSASLLHGESAHTPMQPQLRHPRHTAPAAASSSLNAIPVSASGIEMRGRASVRDTALPLPQQFPLPERRPVRGITVRTCGPARRSHVRAVPKALLLKARGMSLSLAMRITHRSVSKPFQIRHHRRRARKGPGSA